jgi:hypothetical protein
VFIGKGFNLESFNNAGNKAFKYFFNFFCKIFGQSKTTIYLCSPFENHPSFFTKLLIFFFKKSCGIKKDVYLCSPNSKNGSKMGRKILEEGRNNNARLSR